MFSTECECNVDGSEDNTCDEEGRCNCKCNVKGEKCDECNAEYYSFPECTGKILECIENDIKCLSNILILYWNSFHSF